MIEHRNTVKISFPAPFACFLPCWLNVFLKIFHFNFADKPKNAIFYRFSIAKSTINLLFEWWTLLDVDSYAFLCLSIQRTWRGEIYVERKFMHSILSPSRKGEREEEKLVFNFLGSTYFRKKCECSSSPFLLLWERPKDRSEEWKLFGGVQEGRINVAAGDGEIDCQSQVRGCVKYLLSCF